TTAAVRLPGCFEQPVYSPDRRTVALGGNSGTLAVIDARRVRLLSTVRVGPVGDEVRVSSWPSPGRLVAVSYTATVPRRYTTRIVTVDPAHGRVVGMVCYIEADAF